MLLLEGFFALLSNIILFTSGIEGNNSFPYPLSSEKEAEYFRKYRNEGDLEARNILIKHNLRLVVFIAKKYVNYPDNEELISIGTLGLIKAVNSFNPEKGTQLATYASRCIDNEILMTLRSYKKHSTDISLFENIGTDKEGNEMSLMDLLCVDEETTYKDIDNDILKKQLSEIIAKALTDRERYIIMQRFGMCGEEPKTQQAVADAMGISRSYISRIEKKSLLKLRNYLEKNKIRL